MTLSRFRWATATHAAGMITGMALLITATYYGDQDRSGWLFIAAPCMTGAVALAANRFRIILEKEDEAALRAALDELENGE